MNIPAPLRTITHATQVRFRKFHPIDRETPIMEVVFEEEVILDLARADASDVTSGIEVGFHPACGGLVIRANALSSIVDEGTALIRKAEDS